MKIKFHEIAWSRYLDWQQTDKAKIRRVNLLSRVADVGKWEKKFGGAHESPR